MEVTNPETYQHRVLGVDPSTKTGLVFLSKDGISQKILHPSTKLPWYSRVQLIADGFAEMVTEWQPTLVVVEGYAFANRFTLADLVEIGSSLRLCLHNSKIPWYIASPTRLKKYVTGSGNAKKADMATHVRDRWGFESPSDDLVDAYGLARMGLTMAILGSDSLKGVERG